ncbi:unnamed protein product [Brassica oleracea var. botrytis]|uniref:(rape) hypothetical protein n=1 Tax=Brassica napus TaxID=3708 RepID=A0A816IJF0_BRANA|nr:unnamed protein product [Brassica napus]
MKSSSGGSREALASFIEVLLAGGLVLDLLWLQSLRRRSGKVHRSKR